MATIAKFLNEQDFKEPMVVFPLKQYETLLEYIEDIEDRLLVAERMDEPTVSQQEVEELFKKKFGAK